MTQSILHRLAGTIAAIFLPLAAGALWSALSLRFSADLPAMALACAAATWPARHHLSLAPGRVRGLMCVAICGIGIAYAHWLKSATVIAQTIGVGFVDALRLIGSDLAFAIAQARSDRGALTYLLLAAALAYWIGAGGEAVDTRRKSAP